MKKKRKEKCFLNSHRGDCRNASLLTASLVASCDFLRAFFFPVCSFSHSCTFKAGCVTFFFSFFLLSFVPCGCGCFDLFGLVFGRIWRWWWRICWSRSTAWTTRSRPASSSSVTAWARDSSARSFDSRHVLHSSAVRTYVRVIYNFVHGNRTWIGARNWKLGHGTTKHVCLLCRGGGGVVFLLFFVFSSFCAALILYTN